MIRSSSHILKFCNQNKRDNLFQIIEEYQRLVEVIVDDLWFNGLNDFDQSKNRLQLPKFIPTLVLKTYSTWLSARMKQACAKQACSMIKASIEKRRKQLYILNKLQNEGTKSTRNLQIAIDNQPLVKPSTDNIKLELDSRFVDFQQTEVGETFLFVRLTSIGNKFQVRIPIKRTKVFNKWNSIGKMKTGIRLSKHRLYLMYDVPQTPVCGTEVVGADQGLSTVLTLSNGVTTGRCPHGHDLNSIIKKLSRKKKGSNSFKKTQDHRKNHINWSLNQLNFKNIKTVRFEKVKNLRLGRKSSRYLSHWTYTLIKDKLVSLSETEGFRIQEVDNQFRSQRCNSCGFVRKANRKGKTFTCASCGHAADADLNAASNLKLDLYQIPYWVRLKKINRKGFFWKPDGIFDLSQERIVPDATKIPF